MPAHFDQQRHALAAGVPTALAAFLASLPAAEQARITLNELVLWAAAQFSVSTSLGYRMDESVVIEVVAAAQRWHARFGIERWPWNFKRSRTGTVEWIEPTDGPEPPAAIAITPIMGWNGGYFLVSCDSPDELRSGPLPVDDALTTRLTLYEIIAGDFQPRRIGTLAGDVGPRIDFLNVGPYDAGVQVAFAIIAEELDADGVLTGRESYPTPLFSAVSLGQVPAA